MWFPRPSLNTQWHRRDSYFPYMALYGCSAGSTHCFKTLLEGVLCCSPEEKQAGLSWVTSFFVSKTAEPDIWVVSVCDLTLCFLRISQLSVVPDSSVPPGNLHSFLSFSWYLGSLGDHTLALVCLASYPNKFIALVWIPLLNRLKGVHGPLWCFLMLFNLYSVLSTCILPGCL